MSLPKISYWVFTVTLLWFLLIKFVELVHIARSVCCEVVLKKDNIHKVTMNTMDWWHHTSHLEVFNQMLHLSKMSEVRKGLFYFAYVRWWQDVVPSMQLLSSHCLFKEQSIRGIPSNRLSQIAFQHSLESDVDLVWCLWKDWRWKLDLDFCACEFTNARFLISRRGCHLSLHNRSNWPPTLTRMSKITFLVLLGMDTNAHRSQVLTSATLSLKRKTSRLCNLDQLVIQSARSLFATFILFDFTRYLHAFGAGRKKVEGKIEFLVKPC